MSDASKICVEKQLFAFFLKFFFIFRVRFWHISRLYNGGTWIVPCRTAVCPDWNQFYNVLKYKPIVAVQMVLNDTSAVCCNERYK